MCFLKRKNKISKKEKEQAETLFLDFLEGRISTHDFWEEYKNNQIFQQVLKTDKTRWKRTYMLGNVKMYHYWEGPYDRILEFNPDTLLDVVDIKNLYHIAHGLYPTIGRYFLRRNIKYKYGNKEVNYYIMLEKMIPSYINICNEKFLEDIYNSTPASLPKKERIKMGRQKILELYKYDNKKPRWIQPPEWPLDEDGPLVFSHQENDVGKSIYYFYNKHTKAQTIVEQFE